VRKPPEAALSRKYLLQKSIEYTIMRLALGVGPRQFVLYEFLYDILLRLARGMWRNAQST
jgi:hypothetical protein